MSILIDIVIIFKTIGRIFSMSNIEESEQTKKENEEFLRKYGGKNDGK